jgi:2,3-bisphosphoglycerate-independent phosphoglycerate mutase
MKYAIIIPDGAADEPLKELGGKTPIEAAATPNMDHIAMEGRQGVARTVPEGFESGSDVAIMTLLGYDPKVYHTGRAPLEAAAQRIPLAPTDWVFRCNLVTVVDGVMKDHSAGGITDAEAQRLIGDLAKAIKLPGFEFHYGVSYRNLLVYRGSEDFDLKTKPPHEFPEEPVSRYLPRGKGSDVLRKIMDVSKEVFAGHEINEVRKETGHNPATQVWLWGQGHAPNIPTFKERFGVASGCMITGVDLLRGLAVLLGWDVKEVEGMTSFHDTNYAGQGQATAAMLDRYDVGPVLEKLRTFPEWRVLVMPDHPTNISTRKHGYVPSPFAMAGTRVRSVVKGPYSEKNAAASDLRIERGHELMEYFLRGGNL